MLETGVITTFQGTRAVVVFAALCGFGADGIKLRAVGTNWGAVSFFLIFLITTEILEISVAIAFAAVVRTTFILLLPFSMVFRMIGITDLSFGSVGYEGSVVSVGSVRSVMGCVSLGWIPVRIIFVAVR